MSHPAQCLTLKEFLYFISEAYLPPGTWRFSPKINKDVALSKIPADWSPHIDEDETELQKTGFLDKLQTQLPDTDPKTIQTFFNAVFESYKFDADSVLQNLLLEYNLRKLEQKYIAELLKFSESTLASVNASISLVVTRNDYDYKQYKPSRTINPRYWTLSSKKNMGDFIRNPDIQKLKLCLYQLRGKNYINVTTSELISCIEILLPGSDICHQAIMSLRPLAKIEMDILTCQLEYKYPFLKTLESLDLALLVRQFDACYADNKNTLTDPYILALLAFERVVKAYKNNYLLINILATFDAWKNSKSSLLEDILLVPKKELWNKRRHMRAYHIASILCDLELSYWKPFFLFLDPQHGSIPAYTVQLIRQWGSLQDFNTTFTYLLNEKILQRFTWSYYELAAFLQSTETSQKQLGNHIQDLTIVTYDDLRDNLRDEQIDDFTRLWSSIPTEQQAHFLKVFLPHLERTIGEWGAHIAWGKNGVQKLSLYMDICVRMGLSLPSTNHKEISALNELLKIPLSKMDNAHIHDLPFLESHSQNDTSISKEQYFLKLWLSIPPTQQPRFIRMFLPAFKQMTETLAHEIEFWRKTSQEFHLHIDSCIQLWLSLATTDPEILAFNEGLKTSLINMGPAYREYFLKKYDPHKTLIHSKPAWAQDTLVDIQKQESESLTQQLTPIEPPAKIHPLIDEQYFYSDEEYFYHIWLSIPKNEQVQFIEVFSPALKEIITSWKSADICVKVCLSFLQTEDYRLEEFQKLLKSSLTKIGMLQIAHVLQNCDKQIMPDNKLPLWFWDTVLEIYAREIHSILWGKYDFVQNISSSHSNPLTKIPQALCTLIPQITNADEFCKEILGTTPERNILEILAVLRNVTPQTPVVKALLEKTEAIEICRTLYRNKSSSQGRSNALKR